MTILLNEQPHTHTQTHTNGTRAKNLDLISSLFVLIPRINGVGWSQEKKKKWGRASGSFVRQLRGAHCHVTMSWRRWVRWISSGTRSHGWSILAGVCVCVCMNEKRAPGREAPTPPPPNRSNWNLIRLAHVTLIWWDDFKKCLARLVDVVENDSTLIVEAQ